MPTHFDTERTRRHLPHMERRGAPYFVTFATRQRATLAPIARDAVLSTVLYEHGRTSWLHCVVVMPDHVHLILAPFEDWRLSRVLQRIKSVSSHRMNRLLHTDVRWQDESFDRIVRRGEDIRNKGEYVCANPVRAGLVLRVEEYPWIWREWVEGARTGEGACPPP